jgi:hypothetical protein
VREKLRKERADLIQRSIELIPNFQPPGKVFFSSFVPKKQHLRKIRFTTKLPHTPSVAMPTLCSPND